MVRSKPSAVRVTTITNKRKRQDTDSPDEPNSKQAKSSEKDNTQVNATDQEDKESSSDEDEEDSSSKHEEVRLTKREDEVVKPTEQNEGTRKEEEKVKSTEQNEEKTGTRKEEEKVKPTEQNEEKMEVSLNENRVVLRVGSNRTIITSLETLKCPMFVNSFFWNLAEGIQSFKKESDGSIFLDADYDVVAFIIDGLRLGNISPYDNPPFITQRRWVKALDYYGLTNRGEMSADMNAILHDEEQNEIILKERQLLDSKIQQVRTILLVKCFKVMSLLLEYLDNRVQIGKNTIYIPTSKVNLTKICGKKGKDEWIENFIERNETIVSHSFSEYVKFEVNGSKVDVTLHSCGRCPSAKSKRRVYYFGGKEYNTSERNSYMVVLFMSYRKPKKRVRTSAKNKSQTAEV